MDKNPKHPLKKKQKVKDKKKHVYEQNAERERTFGSMTAGGFFIQKLNCLNFLTILALNY